MKNKEVYKMYKGQMCMVSNIEILTPLPRELGANLSLSKLNNDGICKEVMNTINEKIEEIIADNLESDIGKIETYVRYGEGMNE